MSSDEYLAARIVELEKALEALEKVRAACSQTIRYALTPDPEIWRSCFDYGDKTYYKGNKWGNRSSDGMMGLEYHAESDERIWVYRDGSMAKD